MRSNRSITNGQNVKSPANRILIGSKPYSIHRSGRLHVEPATRERRRFSAQFPELICQFPYRGILRRHDATAQCRIPLFQKPPQQRAAKNRADGGSGERGIDSGFQNRQPDPGADDHVNRDGVDAQPSAPGLPCSSNRSMAAGATIPPSAAAAGRTALRRLRNSPWTSSRLISNPTRKKKPSSVRR